MGILDEIVADKKKRLEEARLSNPYDEVMEAALKSTRKSVSFYDALTKDGLSIIGEFKKASPSMGVIDGKIDLTDRIEQYNESVDAISVLTEKDHFNGDNEYLVKIRGMSHLPIIRKDFIVQDYQVYSAKVIGADCILLIAAILDDETMERLYWLAYRLGLDVLLEVHTKEEMRRAVNLGAKIIGVNNRNLKDFTIDLNHTRELSAYLDELTAGGDRPVFVSESGVGTDDDIRFLKQCRVDALLIGRAFMESENPGEKAIHWKKVYDEA